MPASDQTEHPFVQALNETIAALTFLREGGVKTLPVEPEAWRAFTAPTPAQAMPHVPPPAQAARPPAAGSPADTPEARAAALAALRAQTAACRGCALAAGEARLTGTGPCYNPAVAVVNGAQLPGDDPIAIGSRLEGEAGALLDKMFGAIGLPRASLYLTPALKCPAAGRPTATALRACAAHLRAELTLVNPRAIVLLGPVAARALHPTGVAATGKVGQWSLLGRIPTITLHHPMRLLLAGERLADPLKRENWTALKALQARLRNAP